MVESLNYMKAINLTKELATSLWINVSSKLTFRAFMNFAVPLCAMVPRLSTSSSRVIPIPVSLVTPQTTIKPKSTWIQVSTYFISTSEKNTSIHLQICAIAFHITINKSSNHPKVQLSVKQTRRLGAHVIVMVPASESVLMRISKLGFTSIKLGSVTLKNRSLSRASLALLQDCTTTHSWLVGI